MVLVGLRDCDSTTFLLDPRRELVTRCLPLLLFFGCAISYWKIWQPHRKERQSSTSLLKSSDPFLELVIYFCWRHLGLGGSRLLVCSFWFSSNWRIAVHTAAVRCTLRSNWCSGNRWWSHDICNLNFVSVSRWISLPSFGSPLTMAEWS